MTPIAATGLIVGFLGVGLVVGPGALDFTSGSSLRVGAVILAAACYGAGAVYSRTLMRFADPVGLSAIKLSIATLILAPATVGLDGVGDYGSLSSQGWLSLVAVGFISTGLGPMHIPVGHCGGRERQGICSSRISSHW